MFASKLPLSQRSENTQQKKQKKERNRKNKEKSFSMQNHAFLLYKFYFPPVKIERKDEMCF